MGPSEKAGCRGYYCSGEHCLGNEEDIVVQLVLLVHGCGI